MVGSMMEPTVLQQQEQQQNNDYKQIVNEMQKLLPSLEQRIANATLQKENAEELQKLKLLQQVLHGQESAGDSLSLEELNSHAAKLKDVANNLLLTAPSELDATNVTRDELRDMTANISPIETFIEGNIENQETLETVTSFKSSTNPNEVEGKELQSVENNQLHHENFEEIHNAPNKKESESLEMEKESFHKEIDSVSLRRETKENEQVLQTINNTPDKQNVVDNTAKSEQVDEHSTTSTKENEAMKSTVPNEIDHGLDLEKITEIDQRSNGNLGNIAKEALSNFEAPEDIEEMEYEEVELIKIPESTAEDEMILPDSADEVEYSTPKSDDEIEGGEEEEDQVEEEEQGDEQEQVDEEYEQADEEDLEENSVGNENEVDKTGGKYIETVEEAGGEGSDESTNAKEQQELAEVRQDNDSNQKVSEYTKDSNENDNEDTCDDAAHLEEAMLDENCVSHTAIHEDNCTMPVEVAVEMDSQGGTAAEHGELQNDDPLGQPEVANEPLIEADSSQQSSGETAVICVGQTIVSEGTQPITDKVTKSMATVEHDDDDVEIIETHNSPICLDTDDEDEKDVHKSAKVKAIPTTVKTIGDYRQRSQTPKPSTQTEITIKATKSVTETIELLDSSDEDNVGSISRLPTRRRNKRQILPLTVTRTLVKMPVQPVHVSKKRTLLPAVQAPKPLKISQVLSGGAIPAACRAFLTDTPTPSGTAAKSPRSVLLLPPNNFKPTPQSNFLNAVNLLPATATTGDNPLAFSATISNKSIIIPNAFYANRRTTAKEKEKEVEIGKEKATAAVAEKSSLSSSSSPSPSPSSSLSLASLASSSKNIKSSYLSVTQQQERVYREWLDDFIESFANPQQIASHSCLVLMQSALKYKVFARIKDLRTTLNTKAYTSDGTSDGQLLRELYKTFYTDDCRLSMDGLRFCAGACTQIGSNVTLMTDARTGRITTRTSSYDELFLRYCTPNGGGATSDEKRKRQKGDEEYTPAKYYEKKVEKSTTGQGERRKSLRQHRTRCYDETFLYEAEEAEDGEPPTVEQAAVTDKRRQDAQMMALVQRKAEEKRLEAKRQRQQQVKSFESAYLEMFASSLRDTKVKGSIAPKTNNESSSQSRSSNSTDSASNQIIIDDEDEDGLLDDEPRSHRIYKVVPTRLLAAPKRTQSPDNVADEGPKPKRGRPRKQSLLSNAKPLPKAPEPELITCDSTSGESMSTDDDMLSPFGEVPKNVNINWHAGSGDWCKICKKRIPRTVSHYVNEHPNCEVYTSRIPKPVLARLRNEGGQVLEMRPYLNGQEQYAADCVFCQKSCCFKIPYWYQHYSMHTGEYAFRCSGCNVRKTTRSAMMSHINQPCRKRGQLLEDYTYNARPKQIEMRVCRICNYMQLNRRNVLKHLRTQHGCIQVQAKHVESIVLLRMPEPEMNKMPEVVNEFMDLSSGGDENSGQMAMTFNYDDFDATGQAGMWDDGDPTDDLSYMICGMLDVEMREGGE